MRKSEANTKLDRAVRYALRLLKNNYSQAESLYIASRNFKIDIREIVLGVRQIEKSRD